ncbi:BatD family protein [Balneola sp. MJW-20]|uniref:BatD family protein n=1 Tax=Gracilimonas aurantiaca TaxID=3234185 RepID=UPI003465DA17
MRKTGKHFPFLLILISLFLSQPGLLAQDFSVSAELSPDKIFVGEQVQLQLTISGKLSSIDQPELPPIDGLEWLRNYTSRSSSYRIINGRPATETGFSYVLIAREAGNFSIPPITVLIDGENYSTEAISFQVIDRDDLPQDSEERNPDIYVRLEPSIEEPVVGQQVIADIALYFRDGIQVSSYQAAPGWKAEGFWKEELDNPQRVSTTSEIINGVRYQRAKLLQYAIFPTKSGELTLSPFAITVSVRKTRGQSMDIFSFGPNSERIELETNPVTINVRALPEEGDFQFIGGVGEFSISREIVPEEALVGESIEIITTIKGTGNVPLVDKPDYDFPENLEQYNPQETSDVRRSDRQISGSRTFTDVLIARNAGAFEIPEEKVAWFDPENRRYVVRTLPAVSLNILRDPTATGNSGTDLRLNVKPLTGLASWTSGNNLRLYKDPWIWSFLFLPFFATLIAYFYKRHLYKLETDTTYSRSVRAKDKAMEALDQVQGQDIKTAYHLIQKSLMQYITDKLDLPPAGHSVNELLDKVRPLINESDWNELSRIFTKCDTIAYAPNTSQEDLNTDLERSRDLINKMGKKL